MRVLCPGKSLTFAKTHLLFLHVVSTSSSLALHLTLAPVIRNLEVSSCQLIICVHSSREQASGLCWLEAGGLSSSTVGLSVDSSVPESWPLASPRAQNPSDRYRGSIGPRKHRSPL